MGQTCEEQWRPWNFPCPWAQSEPLFTSYVLGEGAVCDGVVDGVGGVCLYVRCVGGREDVFIYMGGLSESR